MKKILGKIRKIFTIIVMILAICMALFTVVSVTTFNSKDRSIFGYKAFIVLSDSMSATDFSAGDLVICKEVDPNIIQADDIITFTSTDNDTYGEVFTHKVRKVLNENNQLSFITYGTTTNVDDSTPVTSSNVIGKYCFHMKGVGRFFNFVKTTPGYICCILVPFLLLIALQAIETVSLFKKYKQEQLDDIRKEKEELRQQREENEKIMKELEELKKQINKNNGD